MQLLGWKRVRAAPGGPAHGRRPRAGRRDGAAASRRGPILGGAGAGQAAGSRRCRACAALPEEQSSVETARGVGVEAVVSAGKLTESETLVRCCDGSDRSREIM